jgi:glutamine---fructose-6-phosphate transaminase (isomerizing)
METTLNYTWTEIQSQPEAWTLALKVLKEQRGNIISFKPADRYDEVIFTGCGSTYYLSLAAAVLCRELTGFPARALPASELWLSPSASYGVGKTLLVAVSRSGETTETLRACEAFLNAQRGDLLTLSCYPEMPLAKMGALNLVFPSAQEQSVAQTRAFSTLYLGTVALACLWAGRADLFDGLSRLPEAGKHLLKDYATLAAGIGRDQALDRFYFLGSGARYGLACELSLKMKEMSLTHSEPFHFMEFRHGPKSMVTPSALVIGLLSAENGANERAVLEDVKALGGRVFALAETGADVWFESGLEEAIQNVLYLPIGQMIAFERSMSKGLNPDRPTNLDSVVKLS